VIAGLARERGGTPVKTPGAETMRKRIVAPDSPEKNPAAEPAWLDLERRARVELSSEAADHPIEAALIPGDARGWRAAQPGAQTIRLLFDQPLSLRHIRMAYSESETARTQEFVLAWSGDGGRSYREILRQQYRFSPPNTTRELEDYRVELEGVDALELRIVPDIDRGPVCATLEQLRLA
jgi:hypothetical protein